MSAATAVADPYPEIGVSDRRHLIDDGAGADVATAGVASGVGGFARRHRWCLSVSVCTLLILLGHALAVYFIYFHCDIDLGNCVAIK